MVTIFLRMKFVGIDSMSATFSSISIGRVHAVRTCRFFLYSVFQSRAYLDKERWKSGGERSGNAPANMRRQTEGDSTKRCISRDVLPTLTTAQGSSQSSPMILAIISSGSFMLIRFQSH